MPETNGHAVIVGNADPGLVKNAMEETGFKNISIIPASRSLLTKDEDNNKTLRDTVFLIEEMEKDVKKWINLTKKRDSKSLKKLKDRSSLYYSIISLLHNNKRYHACGAGRGLAAVSCSGDIFLCHRFVGRDEFKIGSVFEKGLKREEYQKSPVKGNELCSSCFAKYYCGGGCKHDNVGACGSISSPSEDMCRLKCRELELSAVVTSSLDSEDIAFLIARDIFPPKPCPFDFL